MFGFFSRKAKDGPPDNVREAERLIALLGSVAAGEIIRSGALSGNVFCQVFLSQAALFIPPEERTPKVQQDLALFTEMAAKSGDTGSQFNLGKLYLSKVDVHSEFLNQNDMDNIKKAKYWYRMAAQHGLREAKESLKHFEVFDC